MTPGRARGRRRAATVGLAAVVPLAVAVPMTACAREDVASAGGLPTVPTAGADVRIVGDSLTKQSSAAITVSLGELGAITRVSGINGQDIRQRWDALAEASSPTGGEIVVAALGTNNVFFASLGAGDNRSRPMDESIRDIDEAVTMAFASGRVQCLVWVNVNDHTDHMGLSEWAPAFNQALQARADVEAAAGRRMLVADWALSSAGHPEYFLPDEVHLVPAGQQAYAATITAGVQACATP